MFELASTPLEPGRLTRALELEQVLEQDRVRIRLSRPSCIFKMPAHSSSPAWRKAHPLDSPVISGGRFDLVVTEEDRSVPQLIII